MRNEVQHENDKLNEIYKRSCTWANFPTSTFPFHSTSDDLIDHHVLSILDNSQGCQLFSRILPFTSLIFLVIYFCRVCAQTVSPTPIS